MAKDNELRSHIKLRCSPLPTPEPRRKMKLRGLVAKHHPSRCDRIGHHAMLFLTLGYHDRLYLTTELGALGLVLWLYWLTFRLRCHEPLL